MQSGKRRLHYHVIFDVTQAGYKNWGFPAAGLGMALAVWVLASVSKNWSPKPRSNYRLSRIVGGTFCLVWSIGVFCITFSDYVHLRTALTSGNYEKIEGTVTDFVPQAIGDHEPESFRVNGRRFSYSYSSPIAGFNQTHTHDGPIHEGQQVRLAVVGDEIARVEVAEKTQP